MAQINEGGGGAGGEEEAERGTRADCRGHHGRQRRRRWPERQNRQPNSRASWEAAERMRDEREQVAVAERELREAQFSQRECATKLEGAGGRELAKQQLVRVAEDLARCAVWCRQPDPIVFWLQEALEQRVIRRRTLAGMHDTRWSATAELRRAGRDRLKIEQGLNPLRDRIGELRLKEQAAAMNDRAACAAAAEARPTKRR